MRPHRNGLSAATLHAAVALAVLVPALGFAATAAFPEFADPNPGANNGFGTHVVVLASGNVVVTSPRDDYNAPDAGAVYLFNGSTGALISALRGGSSGDHVGSGGVVALTNGDAVVVSPDWGHPSTPHLGAVTHVDGSSGLTGDVSALNSLTGSTAEDAVGDFGVTALPNGNYVVTSVHWDNGAAVDAGAVTLENPNAYNSGTVSSSNSLVGSASYDFLGNGGITIVGNGNYVVQSPAWANGAIFHAGAATWCSGATGRTGLVSSANSLVGASSSDAVSNGGVTVLTNGNFVVSSPYANVGGFVDSGAATFGLGNFGLAAVVGGALSLNGASNYDQVGTVWPLTNGNYVVTSNFKNGTASYAGAATWCSGITGRTATVSSANSLVGGTSDDGVGGGGVLALSNGHYVVLSTNWDNGAVVDAGAATWCNGTTGRTGLVTAANSLITNQNYGRIGRGGVALATGNYVVWSWEWDNGAAIGAGAVTFCNGTSGTTGLVSSANSLVGTTADDVVAHEGVMALPSGNYLVLSSYWHNGALADAGALTWCSGTTGRVGAVSAANSLVGSAASERLAMERPVVLANGNYVVRSQYWANGASTQAGAITWGSGSAGVFGPVSAANSLVGTQVNDQIGSGGITPLASGHFVVGSPFWDNGPTTDAGAATWCSGTGGTVGAVSTANSIVGSTSADKVGGDVEAVPDGSWVIVAPNWDNGSIVNAGAACWASAGAGSVGTITQENSAFGFKAGSGLAGVVVDSTRNTFAASFLWEEGGHVRVGPLANFELSSVVDVPGDQGGWVRASFTCSPYDHASAATPVLSYGVWRRIPGSAPSFAAARVAPLDGAALETIRASLGPDVRVIANGGTLVVSVPETETSGVLPAGSWELLTSVTAFAQPTYTVVLPTVTNLTSTEFLVTAHTKYNTVWFTTPTVLGQSVDNLAPAPPQSFAGTYASGNTHLSWAPNGEGDLAGYRLYRGGDTGFTPSLANRIGTPTGTTFDDGTAGAYVYKLTAVDVNGNESPVATVIPTGTTGVAGEGPVAFALEGAHPNPARGHALRIAFALPNDAPAKLELLDVSGRRVVTRDVGALGAGRHTVSLSESRRIPSGLYWARLTQGARQKSVRVSVIE